MRRIVSRQQFVYFHPMNEKPDRAKDLNGNEELFSISVMAYDAELDCWTIAWYNYDMDCWMDHSGDSLIFSMWCKFPNPNSFIELNTDLPKIKNCGYAE